MSSTGRVNGVDLTIVKEWSRQPRVLHEGQELPRDRFGNYRFHDLDGRPARLQVTYHWWELRPQLRIGKQSVLLGRPVPAWIRVCALVFVAVGVLGGAALDICSAAASVTLVRRENRRPWQLLVAAALPLVAVGIYVIGVLLLHPGVNALRLVR